MGGIFLKNNKISQTDITSTGIFTHKVNKDGLIFHIDASDYNTTKNELNTVFDMSGYGNNMNSSTGGVQTAGSAKGWTFTSSGHVMTGGLSGQTNREEVTLEVWLYPNPSEIVGDDRGCILLLNGGSNVYMSWNKGASTISNYWYSHTPEGYHETFGSLTRGRWHHFCTVWDNRNCHQWVNGEYGVVKGVRGTSTPNPNLSIGREGGGRQFSGFIGIARIYNRALNGYEVVENFSAERERFGV
jgi:hypothetical protein